MKGCTELLGVLNKTYLDNILTPLIIPGLRSSGVITPKKLAAFLLKNVVESTASKIALPGTARGYHQVTGSPLQTYAVSRLPGGGGRKNASVPFFPFSDRRES